MKIPSPDTITPTTPLRLEVAAALGFPDGSMTTGALRRLAAAQKLAHEKIAGKYFVTLAAIEDMRAACRVPANAPAPRGEGPKAINSYEPDGSLALAAMKAKAEELLEKLRPVPATRPKLRRRF